MSASSGDGHVMKIRSQTESVRRLRSPPEEHRRSYVKAVPPGVQDVPSILRLQRTAGNCAAGMAVAARPASAPLVVARAPDAKPPRPGSLIFAGATLGTTSQGKAGKALREIGNQPGYDGRLQAISVTRIAKVDPAAVVLGTDERWHGVVTDLQFETGQVAGAATTGAKPILRELHGVPSVGGIEAAKKSVDDLTAKILGLSQLEEKWKNDPDFRKSVRGANPPFPQALEAQREHITVLLKAARLRRASTVLGVPEADINPIRTATGLGRQARKVNLVEQPDKNSPGGAHNPLGSDINFHEGVESALTLDIDQLDNPVRAQSILFHEAQHVSDWELAQRWIRNYRAETGALFVEGQPGRKPFEAWLNKQVTAKRLTKADVEMIVMQTLNSSAYTEARANVTTFLAVLQSGDPVQAEKELVAYANNLKPESEGGLGKYASPPTDSQVLASVVADLKAAYQQMKPSMRAHYDRAVVAAIAKYPRSWITDLRFAPSPRQSRR